MAAALLLALAELVGDELQHGLQSLFGALAFRIDDYGRPLAGGQHHHTHDALGIDAAAAPLHPDLAGKGAGKLCQLGRSAGMQPELVDDFNFDARHVGTTLSCQWFSMLSTPSRPPATARV